MYITALQSQRVIVNLLNGTAVSEVEKRRGSVARRKNGILIFNADCGGRARVTAARRFIN